MEVNSKQQLYMFIEIVLYWFIKIKIKIQGEKINNFLSLSSISKNVKYTTYSSKENRKKMHEKKYLIYITVLIRKIRKRSI